MKRTLFLTFFTLMVSGGVFGQESIIEINPFGENKYPKKVKKGSTVKFKINNVNTFKINGVSESKPLDINFEVPEIFKNLTEIKTNGDRKNIDSLLPSKMVRSLSDEFEQIIREAKWDKIDTNSLTNLLNKFKKNEEQEQKELNIEWEKSRFISKFSIFVKDFHSISQQIALEDKVVHQLKDSIFIKNPTVLKNNVIDYFCVVYINESTEDAKKRVVETLNSLILIYTEMQTIYDALNKTSKKDVAVLSGILTSEDKKTSIKIEKATVNQDQKKYFLEEMAFAKKAFETISNIENRNKIIKKAQAGIDLYNEINNATFIAYTDAEQLNSDEVILTPKLKFVNGKVAHEFKSLTLKTYGGIKVNFSAGYLVSFVGDDNYSNFKDIDGNIIGVYQTNKNDVTHALGGLVHSHSNWNSDVQLGLSAGASLATNGNLGFYMGGSLFFLEKNRLILTGGYSFIKVDKLNTANLKVEDGRYKFISSTDTEIRYDNVYKGALFIGITYNLTK